MTHFLTLFCLFEVTHESPVSIVTSGMLSNTVPFSSRIGNKISMEVAPMKLGPILKSYKIMIELYKEYMAP